MQYNLIKLLKGQTIPQLSNYITEELKPYGECKYTPYQDGGYHLHLETESELTETQLEEVKQIILSHDAEKSLLDEENSKIIEARKARYEKEIDGLVLEKLRVNFPDIFKEENAKVEQIKKELPKKN